MNMPLQLLAGYLGCVTPLPRDVAHGCFGSAFYRKASKDMLAYPLLVEESIRVRTGGPHTVPSRASVFSDAPWRDLRPSGAAIDSRTLKPYQLFFCLKGERTDGHAHAANAARAGAAAIIAERHPFDEQDAAGRPEPPVFIVPDCIAALQRLAFIHRDEFCGPVVGVTGSAGKTTLKESLAQVLAAFFPTQSNPGNLNNHIGLPLSLLNAAPDAAYWIMEAGISEPGDMDELGAILSPDFAVILNVGEAHLEGLGRHGVAHYKARMLDYLRPGGCAVVSADYPELLTEADARRDSLARRNVEIVTFSSTGKEADYMARYLGPAPAGLGLYLVETGGQSYEVKAPFRSGFGAENVAAVFAVATKLGLSPRLIQEGLLCVKLPGQRFQRRETKDVTLIDDSYNANPLSARRMVEAAGDLARETQRPLILVMGEMLELGERAGAAHRELGLCMAKELPSLVFWKGGHGDDVREGLMEGGFKGTFLPVAAADEFASLLDRHSPASGVILFKGSRGNHLEHLVAAFCGSPFWNGDPDAL